MTSRIMAHEWMLLSREKALYLIVPLYLLMLVYGTANGTFWKATLQNRTAAAVSLASDNITSKVATLDRMLSGQQPYRFGDDPRVAGALARYKAFEMAAKPLSPTAAITVGQSDIAPSFLRVQWKPMFRQTNIDEIVNPRTLEIGAFDLAFVIIYLYPLLIIASSFNILSSEREGGTQVLLLSQPVSLLQFVMGKILLRGAIIIGAGTAMTIAALLIGNPDILVSGSWWRIGMLAAVMVLYGSFWFALAILVNAFGARSATNALALMATWLAIVVVMPSALNLGAKLLYPLPSRIEMVQALRAGDELARQQGPQKRIYGADMLRKGEEEATETSMIAFLKKILPLEAKGEQLAAPIFHRFDAQKAQQQRLVEELKFVSPAALTQAALNELADQGTSSFENFNRQVMRFQRQWRAYFLPPVLEARMLTRDEILALPRFHYVAESDLTIGLRVLGELVALGIFFLIATVGGVATLKRYPAVGR